MLTEILNVFSGASCLQDINQNISPITMFLPRNVFFVQRFHDCVEKPITLVADPTLLAAEPTP